MSQELIIADVLKLFLFELFYYLQAKTKKKNEQKNWLYITYECIKM